MATIYDQLKTRRKQLQLKQRDMELRVGMTRQQYQRLESGGNPRLDNLQLVAEGLDAELLLVPKEHLQAVRQLLSANIGLAQKPREEPAELSADNPWADILK